MAKFANVYGSPDGRGTVCADCRRAPGHCRSAMPLASTAPICKNEPLPGRRFCAEHAEQLDRVRMGGTAAPTATENTETAATGKARASRIAPVERAAMLGRAVHAADGLATDAAVKACGLNEAGRTFRRTLQCATQRGWVRVTGRGPGSRYLPGDVTPPAQQLPPLAA